MKIGNKAWYRGGWGHDPRVLVTITGMGEKNGEAVYDTSNGHWGYADQFEPYRDTREERLGVNMQELAKVLCGFGRRS